LAYPSHSFFDSGKLRQTVIKNWSKSRYDSTQLKGTTAE
ncbi:MAG: hypothetical protein ACI9HY_003702, partial [Planctomycetaceae bacterium]